ncbi:MAG: hypothetical protein HY825_01840 [Acidobacteria bacterium]|nr:hypothetical protein [Acidobacteriota bacterium]
MLSYPPPPSLSTLDEGCWRLDLVAEFIRRPDHHTAARVADRHGTSPQHLYELANRAADALRPRRSGPRPGSGDLARLRAENAVLEAEVTRLRNEVAERDARLARSVEVTERRLQQLELVSFRENASLRGIRGIVAAAYGAEHRPRLATLQADMKEHGRVAREIVDRARAQVADRLPCVMADDIYFHRSDVKVVAEPWSMALLNVGRWDGSSGLDWMVWLEEYEMLAVLASDLAKDLVGAATQLGLDQAADYFHEMWWFDRKLLDPLSRAEAHLRDEWWAALDRGTRPEGPGRRLSEGKVKGALADAEAAEAAFFTAMTAVDRLREVYEPINPATGRLWTEAEAGAAVDGAIKLLSTIESRPGQRAVRHVQEHRRRYFGHLKMYGTIDVPLRDGSTWSPRTVMNGIIKLGELRRGLNDPGAWTGWRAWLDNRRLADDLERRLRRECLDFDGVVLALYRELRCPKRSSSGVESLNSRLRVLQMVHRTVSDEMLGLVALAWNLTPRSHPGRPKGKSPYEMLGIEIGQGDKPWYDVLLDYEESHKAAA